MNILLINHYAGSPSLGMEFRPFYLAREWVRRGHRVRIVAASFSHVRARQPQVGKAPTIEAVDGVEYCWLPTPPYRGNGAARLWNIWHFVWPLWRGAARLAAEFRPDAVVASSTYPMDIWVARRIANHVRPKPARLVFEIHDLWPLSPIELSGMSRWHPFAMLCQWAEHTAYRDADVAVSILPCVQQHVEAHGLAPSKLALVPNGISPEDWAGEPEPLRADVAAVVAAHRRAGRTVVGYVGSMGVPNALDTLLDAAALVRQQPIGLVLVGDGFERERLSRRLLEERLDNVCLCAPIPKRQVPAFLKAVDIAYIGWRRVPIYRFGIAPNKLMDYMMAGCAVLHSVEAGNDLVAESGCGLSVPPESASAVADGLLRMAAFTPEQRRDMGARGRAFVLAHHTYPVLAQRFLEAVEHHAR